MTLKKLNQFWKKINKKDSKTFGEFYDLYYPSLLSRAFKFIDNREDCLEIVQETFIEFWKKSDTITPEKHFMEAYLWQILRSKISKYYKGKKIQKLHLEDYNNLKPLVTYDPDLVLNEDSLEKRINSLIDNLPVKSKRIFLMSRTEEKTYTEIAQELEISVKTVEYHISSALKVLRAKLKGT